MVALLILACTAATPVDTGDTGEVIEDSGDTGDPPPADHDRDGWDETEDCDDLDPAVNPGAVEVAWNGVDDDCDGRVDGNGTYTGDVELTARAVFKGTPYTFLLTCPATLERAASDIFEMNVSILPLVACLERAGYRLGILSNTCRSHWEHCRRRFRIVAESFSVYALSYEIHAMKPDAE